jgi:hypothetical protein
MDGNEVSSRAFDRKRIAPPLATDGEQLRQHEASLLAAVDTSPSTMPTLRAVSDKPSPS